MSISALSTGINGIQQGMLNLRRDAAAVTQAITHEGGIATQDLTRALVNMKLDTLQVKASAKVVETVHNLMGELLDVKA